MAVVVKRDQPVGVVDVEDDAGAEHHQADAEYPGKYRHEEPVAEVGEKLALAPPRRPGLQDQKWESTVNTTASPIVTGATFATV